MEIRTRREGDVFVVDMVGRLDSRASGPVSTELNQIAQGGHRKILLNVAGVEYISSAGLKILMSVRKRLEQHPGGGAIRLAAARPHVLDVFRLSGLDAVFTAHDSVEAALSARAAA